MFREASAAWCSALNMPTPGMVKLNVHVKISKDFTTLVVVAQNDNGKIWKTRAKEHIFLWSYASTGYCNSVGFVVGKLRKFPKSYHGEMQRPVLMFSLEPRTLFGMFQVWLVIKINELRNSFECCNLWRVRREANEVAHTMEEFASPLRLFLSCNKTSLLKVKVSHVAITCIISLTLCGPHPSMRPTHCETDAACHPPPSSFWCV